MGFEPYSDALFGHSMAVAIHLPPTIPRAEILHLLAPEVQTGMGDKEAGRRHACIMTRWDPEGLCKMPTAWGEL